MKTHKSLLIEEETIKRKHQEIDKWMSDSGLPGKMKMEITKYVKEYNVAEKYHHVDVDIKLLLSCTPTRLMNSFKEHLCIKALKKVPMLHMMSEVALRMMCAYAKPQIYLKNRYVFRKGKPLNKMIIILEGTILCGDAEDLTSSSVNTETLIRQKGDWYGERLLVWEPTDECPNLTCSQDVQCQTKVEALVFTCESEMKKVIDYWRPRYWDQNSPPRLELTVDEVEIERILSQMSNKSGTTEKTEDEELKQKKNIMLKKKAILEWVSRNNLPDNLKTEIMTNMKVGNDVGININADVDVKWLLSTDLQDDISISIRKHLCMNTLKRVPILENMDEDVLKSICKHLEPVVYTENDYLCRTGDRLEFMLIIIEGIFVWTNRHGGAATSSSPLTTRGIVKGDFCGEDIISWVSPNNSFSAPTPAPIWRRDIKCQKKVEAFALTAENLRQVVSENKIKWDQSFSNCAGVSTSGTTEHRALEQLIQVQGDMLSELLDLVRESMFQFRDDMATLARRLDDMTEFLPKSGYPGAPPPTP